MKLKPDFLLREVAGETVVLPMGSAMELNMMITLNETGKFLWQRLEQETDEDALVAALLEEYDVDEAAARTHVEAFVAKLRQHEFLA